MKTLFFLLTLFILHNGASTAYAAVEARWCDETEIEQLLKKRQQQIAAGLPTKEVDLELARRGHYFPVKATQKQVGAYSTLEFEMLSLFDQKQVEVFTRRLMPHFPWLKEIKLEPGSYHCTFVFVPETNEDQLKELLIHFHYLGYFTE